MDSTWLDGSIDSHCSSLTTDTNLKKKELQTLLLIVDN